MPYSREPRVRARAHLVRSVDQIEQGLRGVLRGLVHGDRPWPMYLYGDAGTGKTRAALALCDHVPGSWYLTVDQLCTEVLERRDGVTWRHLPGYTLVVVDELAVRRTAGDLEYTSLCRLADTREDRPTLYISNVAPADLVDVYDERIASRVLCGTVYHLVGRDRRRDT